jgi:hypothetical protein
MALNWFWQGLLVNWLFSVIVLASGGAMFWLKLRQSRWSPPILYGLAASALTALTLYAISVQHHFSVEQASQTTTDNVESRVRSWLDDFRLTVARSTNSSTDYWRYTVHMPNTNNIEVARLKERDSYVTIFATIYLAPADVAKIPKDKLDTFRTTLFLEAGRAGVGFSMSLDSVSPKSVTMYLEKRVPITTALAEDALVSSIDRIDTAMLLLRTEMTSYATLPSTKP